MWRFTDMGYDTTWPWTEAGAEEVYDYLVDGAKAYTGASRSDFTATVSITPPADVQIADPLIGPFTVHTDQPVASVTSTPTLPVVDRHGGAVDPSAVPDGQEIYLDARGTFDAGSVTVTATVPGSSATGLIASVPNVPGDTPTAGDHAQSFMLIAPAGTRTVARATSDWVAPTIHTDLTDAADGDKYVAASGGTVIDTVRYANLVPGASYVLTGELMDKSSGEPTGITGSTTFTASASGSGEVQVTFNIPAAWAGSTLVAFETLYRDDAVVAEHHDIDDAAQTIVINSASETTLSTQDVTATPSQSQPSDVSNDHPSATATSSDDVGPSLTRTGVSDTTSAMAGGALLLLGLGAAMVVQGRRRAGLR